MSKIFDALRKARGEVASLALPLIESAGKANVAADPRRDVHVIAPKAVPAVTPRLEVKQFERPPAAEVTSGRVDSVIFHAQPSSPAADRFRLLGMRLGELWAAGKLKSVMIASPLPGEGKSTVALNLATALTEKGKRTVLLIDADLHQGCLNERLGLALNDGLAECLRDGTDPLSLIQRVEPLGFHFLSCGRLQDGSPTELLQAQEISRMMQILAPHFDWIVLDSPPVLPLSDAVALTRHVDGSLLVARAGYTPAEAIEDTVARLGKKHVIGLVLNGVENSRQPYAAYQAYYQKRETSPAN